MLNIAGYLSRFHVGQRSRTYTRDIGIVIKWHGHHTSPHIVVKLSGSPFESSGLAQLPDIIVSPPSGATEGTDASRSGSGAVVDGGRQSDLPLLCPHGGLSRLESHADGSHEAWHRFCSLRPNCTPDWLCGGLVEKNQLC